MTQETGTLKELNVKPGDVVELCDTMFDVVGIDFNNRRAFMLRRVKDGTIYNWAGEAKSWRIISRATPPVDLTLIRIPLGLLDEVYGPGTQKALKAHGGPYQRFDGHKWIDCGFNEGWLATAYRVKPAPVVKAVTLGIIVHPSGSFRITATETNGALDSAATLERLP